MLEKLLQYYPNILIDEIPTHYENYEWFTDESDRMIGILKTELTKKDKELLSIFLTSIPIDECSLTQEQHMWKDLLFHETIPKSFSILQSNIKYVRFLHFSIKQPFFERKAWGEALHGMLPSSFVVVWADYHNGIIIETYPYETTLPTLDHEMIHTLTSDFFVSLKILAGKVRNFDESFLPMFQWENSIFQQTKQFMNKQYVYQLEDVLPYLLIHNPKIIQPLLNHVQHDVLQTIRIYLECNMNVSLAAKKLYMHRNSVQYRVDKFIDQTGIDIKTFKGAITVYFALLLQETS